MCLNPARIQYFYEINKDTKALRKITEGLVGGDGIIPFGDNFIISSYEDKKKLDFFIKNVDLVTFEFENIPFKTLDYVQKKIKLLQIFLPLYS